ncbi:hypothetical protein O3P69_006246 [Scylla paramamosain]|uniref:Ionotropic glutamate receptor C-terminal domain-containing protein n=1 Tax=Scylla paramamosain TaxID=85552 RepID=A0AAW0U7B1_SCYPA
MAVVVAGPSRWVLTVVSQWDSLLIAPDGKLEKKVLSAILPLAVKVVVLELTNFRKRNRCDGVISVAKLQHRGWLVLISSWVVVVVLVAVYRGNLTAFLSIPMVASPPTTIQELLDMGYTLSVSRGYSQYHKMKTSPIMHHLEAFKRAELRQDQGILPKEEYITRLQTQPLALLVTVMAVPLVMDKYAETRGAERVCTLQMSSEKLFLEIGGLAFPKNSPIKYLFDQHCYALRSRDTSCFLLYTQGVRLDDSGDIPVFLRSRRYGINWIRATKKGHIPDAACVTPRLGNDELKPLGLPKVGGLLAAWVTGVLIAVVTFLLEVFTSVCGTTKSHMMNSDNGTY